MSVRPNWRPAVCVYLAYNGIIFATLATAGARYTDMVSEHVAFASLALPPGLGALFMAGAITWLGWWRPAL
ncbi:hypothetical protein [Sphingopyxis sp.]|uniref:hypothetical protein n=1 Tax=Sphingopyxis sp. TaxID=1908224 RepID=UPI0025DB7815|nr:hypothetical protein [Sphingopyxis sp.]MBK6413048.1 hypothetical protein [Sphingopyxis sp.]